MFCLSPRVVGNDGRELPEWAALPHPSFNGRRAVQVSVRAKKKAEPLPQVDINTLVWPQPPQQRVSALSRRWLGSETCRGSREKRLVSSKRRPVSRSPMPNCRTCRSRTRGGRFEGTDLRGRLRQKMVFVFDLEKKTLSFRGDKPPAHIKIAIGVAIDDKDRLFVSDAAQGLITLFDVNGKFITEFGAD